jgi:hypothetical protein
MVLDEPLGRVADHTLAKDLMAMGGSFVFTTDGSTYLPGGTGTGATLMLSGASPS